jgi:hypothetical protein
MAGQSQFVHQASAVITGTPPAPFPSRAVAPHAKPFYVPLPPRPTE